MRSHELAKALLEMPDGELVASLDIETDVKDKHGDEIIAKVFGYSMIEAFASQNEVVLQFEGSGAGGEGVDVIEVVKAAQRGVQASG
ncbi:hypothetical protein REH81_12065 [Vibrio rotiferianus]